MCDSCVECFGQARAPGYCFEVRSCLLCGEDSNLTARVKPPTSGARIVTIDGGGCRGVIPLQFLTGLQHVLGPGCNLLDFVDLAVGTSSGKFPHEVCNNADRIRWLDCSWDVLVPLVR